tara:strand:+ start:822 stop:1460 length:639 start_codon:yes stop_codon:yes gene_type:complete
MKNEFFKRLVSSIILIPLALFFIIKGSLFFIFFISLCFLITSYEWYMMSKKKSYSILGFIFLIFSFYSVYKLRINPSNDYWFLLFITTICVSTDIGGYVFGKILKGPKLTKFSPNKTYSGMIGGYLLSLIFITIFVNDISAKVDLPINWFVFVIFVSSISQIGDIIISYFKRLSKIKDTGKIIPGHGGLLDRVDGMIFALPFSYIILLTDSL